MAVYPERRSGRLSGCWIAEVTHLGDRRRKRFASKHEAERWADFTKLTGSAPPEVNERAQLPKSTFGNMARETLEHHAGWQGRRDPSRDQRLTYAVDVLGADTPVDKITMADLDRLVASLRKRPGRALGEKRLSPGSINRYLATVSAVLTYAHKRYGTTKPAFPWQEEDGHRIHWLTEAQEEAVVAAILADGRPAEALLVRVLARTGLRWGEFETLTPGQVQTVGGDAWIKLDKTKTNTPRDVPIDPALAGELRELIENKGVPKYSTFRDTLYRVSKCAGQNFVLTPHILRHTCATRLVHAGVNLAIVQKFMGHSSIQTTLKYTHVADEALQQAMKKLTPHAGQSKILAFESPTKSTAPEPSADCISDC